MIRPRPLEWGVANTLFVLLGVLITAVCLVVEEFYDWLVGVGERMVLDAKMAVRGMGFVLEGEVGDLLGGLCCDCGWGFGFGFGLMVGLVVVVVETFVKLVGLLLLDFL
jgi:hypothetical protein